jgi:hypothetical protein
MGQPQNNPPQQVDPGSLIKAPQGSVAPQRLLLVSILALILALPLSCGCVYLAPWAPLGTLWLSISTWEKYRAHEESWNRHLGYAGANRVRVENRSRVFWSMGFSAGGAAIGMLGVLAALIIAIM